MVNKTQIVIQCNPFLLEAHAVYYNIEDKTSTYSVLASQWCNDYLTGFVRFGVERKTLKDTTFFPFYLLSVRERTAVATGLVGCIRMLDVNNRVLNLQENGGDSLYGSGVGECGNNPCQPNPCKNGATCQVKEAEMFHCKCTKGFWGKMQTNRSTGSAVVQFSSVSNGHT